MSESEAPNPDSTGDEAAQNPQGGGFKGPVGSVGNQGTQHNVAGVVQGNQVYVAGDYYEAQPISEPTGIPHNLPRSGAAAFVGRDEEIETLHQQLQESDRIAIAAIEGMGGIGKTELALQYAIDHLQQQTYPGGLCWLRARGAEVGSQIVSFALSHLGLNLPDGLELQEQVGFCWSHWRDGEVLLVFDDVTDYDAVAPFLPPSEPRFNVLFTTRLRIGTTVQELRLDVLSEAAAIELLVQLVGKERIQGQIEDAKALCQWLGYLPLGLELVGRYLEGKPDLTLAKMQQRLENKRLAAKALVGTKAGMTGKLGVAAAFELSWQELSEPSQQLGGLLSLFALAPIPWSLVESVAKECSPTKQPRLIQRLLPFLFKQHGTSDRNTFRLVAGNEVESARDNLLKLHLLQRTRERTYQLHQLIREFFTAKREVSEGIELLKQGYCRAMVAVTHNITWPPSHDMIAAFAPTTPHLGEAITTMSDKFNDEDLITPFIGIAWYWEGQGSYAQAQPWYEQCLVAVRNRLGENHLDTGQSLNNLAELYRAQGHYEEAEPLYLQALKIAQQQGGKDCSYTAASLNNLATLYESQGRYEEAEPLYLQALSIAQQQGDENHIYPYTAASLNNLALLYRTQGRYEEAEPLYLQTIQILKQQLDEDHPYTATNLKNLAVLYQAQGRYSDAEFLYLQALQIFQQKLGENHPDTAQSLRSLAALYRVQGRYEEAEFLFLQALEILQQKLGENHPDTAQALNSLAVLYAEQGCYEEAENLYLQAMEICQRQLGQEHPGTAQSLDNLAELYTSQGRYEEAEPLYLQAIEIFQQKLGGNHPDTTISLNNLAGLYREQSRYKEAENLYLQALQIFEQSLGTNHPNTITVRNNLDRLRSQQ